MNKMKISLRTVKDIVFSINVIFFIIGLIIIVISGIGYAFLNKFGLIFEYKYSLTLQLCIILGIAIIFSSLFGYLGVVKESRCLLLVHTLFTIALILSEFVIIFILSIQKSKLFSDIQQILWAAYEKYNSSLEYRNSIDSFQTSLKCCGFNKTIIFNSTIVSSCCTPRQICTISNVYGKNCPNALSSIIQGEIYISIALILILILVDTLSIFVSCILARQVDDIYDELK